MLILGVLIVVVMILVDLSIVLASGKLAEYFTQRKGSSERLINKLVGALLMVLAAYVAITRKQA